MFRRLIHWSLLLIAFWVLLVSGLPAARRAIPGVCAARHLEGGFCRVEVQDALARVDTWVQTHLVPLPRHARVQRALVEAAEALQRVEALVRDKVGDEQVDASLRAADGALRRLEGAVTGAGDVRGKLAEVPANANLLLSRVRAAFDRLRGLLASTSRRTEEVAGAVEETQKALDALSGVLPRDDKAVGSGQ